MDARTIVGGVIEVLDPFLARRIYALLWAYERGELRHQVRYGPLVRRRAERQDSNPRPRPAPMTHRRAFDDVGNRDDTTLRDEDVGLSPEIPNS
jgi:hypothetical protein